MTLGLLTTDLLKTCVEKQEGFRKQGMSPDLGQVILHLGLAPADLVAKAMMHGGTGALRCPGCKRRFTVPDYQASRRYKCEPCKAYLEAVQEEILKPFDPAGAKTAAAPAAALKPIPVKGDPFEGKIFGKYRILHRVGKGGMGAVYLCEETEGGQKWAMKILTEEFSRMPGIQKRFEREGTAGQRLDHPSIVKTIEMSKEGPYVYIVMEYVDGGDLAAFVLKEKQVAPPKAAEMIGDVLVGLQHAHENGIVHRDIKPGNILLMSDGRAKVIDFGLAMDAEAQTILTLAGNVMGTPAYMSPEQAVGEKASALSDQYSCGIVAFLMLAGRKPFEGKGLVETLNKQLKEPLPSLRSLAPAVPEALEKVIQKMCAKQPDKRYKTAGEAANALRKAVGLAVEEKAPAEPLPDVALPQGPPLKKHRLEPVRRPGLMQHVLAIVAGAAGFAAAYFLVKWLFKK